MTGWPRLGRCGACGRPAIQFPSLHWEHHGRPCEGRSRRYWPVDDTAIFKAARFIPDGENLPPLPAEIRDRLAHEAEDTP